MRGGIALDGRNQDFAGLVLGGGPQLLLVLLDARGNLAAQLHFQPFHEHLLSLLAVERADFVELDGFLLDDDLQLLAPFFDLVAAFAQLALVVFQDAFLLELGLVLLIEHVLTFFQPAFLFADFLAGFFNVPVEFLAFLEQLVLRLELGIADDVVGLFARLIG